MRRASNDLLTDRAFGLLLGGLRRRLGWTQEQLGVRWGKSTPTIKRIEAGRSQPDLGALHQLAKLLGGTTSDLVALTEALAADLASEAGKSRVAHGAFPGLDEIPIDPGQPPDAVNGWLARLEWSPAAPGDRNPWMPRPPGRAVERPPPEPASAPPHAEGADVAPAAGPTIIHHDIPWVPARVEMRNGRVDRYSERTPRQEARRRLALLLAGELLAGRELVGARFPGGLDSGALAAELAGQPGVLPNSLPALFVAATPEVADSALARMGELRPEVSRAAASGRWAPWLGFAITDWRTAAEWLRLRPPDRPDWRLVIVDGLRAAERLGRGSRSEESGLDGIPVVVFADAMEAGADGLDRLLGRPPDAELRIGEAMIGGLIPRLECLLVEDPIDHRSVPTHISWFHPGKAGEALSKDERLEALLAAGAFHPKANCLLHVVDDTQEAWAKAWLKRRLGREVEPSTAHLSESRGRRSGREEATAELERPQGTSLATPAAPGRTWICQRAQPPRSTVRDLDEVVFLDVAFAKHLLRQLGDALERTRDGERLRAWELTGDSIASSKRGKALLDWLGLREGHIDREILAALVHRVGGRAFEEGASPVDEFLLSAAAGSPRVPPIGASDESTEDA